MQAGPPTPSPRERLGVTASSGACRSQPAAGLRGSDPCDPRIGEASDGDVLETDADGLVECDLVVARASACGAGDQFAELDDLRRVDRAGRGQCELAR